MPKPIEMAEVAGLQSLPSERIVESLIGWKGQGLAKLADVIENFQGFSPGATFGAVGDPERPIAHGYRPDQLAAVLRRWEGELAKPEEKRGRLFDKDHWELATLEAVEQIVIGPREEPFEQAFQERLAQLRENIAEKHTGVRRPESPQVLISERSRPKKRPQVDIQGAIEAARGAFSSVGEAVTAVRKRPALLLPLVAVSCSMGVGTGNIPTEIPPIGPGVTEISGASLELSAATARQAIEQWKSFTIANTSFELSGDIVFGPNAEQNPIILRPENDLQTVYTLAGTTLNSEGVGYPSLFFVKLDGKTGQSTAYYLQAAEGNTRARSVFDAGRLDPATKQAYLAGFQFVIEQGSDGIKLSLVKGTTAPASLATATPDAGTDIFTIAFKAPRRVLVSLTPTPNVETPTAEAPGISIEQNQSIVLPDGTHVDSVSIATDASFNEKTAVKDGNVYEFVNGAWEKVDLSLVEMTDQAQLTRFALRVIEASGTDIDYEKATSIAPLSTENPTGRETIQEEHREAWSAWIGFLKDHGIRESRAPRAWGNAMKEWKDSYLNTVQEIPNRPEGSAAWEGWWGWDDSNVEARFNKDWVMVGSGVDTLRIPWNNLNNFLYGNLFLRLNIDVPRDVAQEAVLEIGPGIYFPVRLQYQPGKTAPTDGCEIIAPDTTVTYQQCGTQQDLPVSKIGPINDQRANTTHTLTLAELDALMQANADFMEVRVSGVYIVGGAKQVNTIRVPPSQP